MKVKKTDILNEDFYDIINKLNTTDCLIMGLIGNSTGLAKA